MRTTAVPKSYRKTQILTASPLELMLMLYDGAVASCEQARQRLASGDYEVSHALLVKAENLVAELSGGLRRGVHPELVSNLSRLFEFVFFRLFEANMSRNARCIDEALDVLRALRDAWREASASTADAVPGGSTQAAPGTFELSA